MRCRTLLSSVTASLHTRVVEAALDVAQVQDHVAAGAYSQLCSLGVLHVLDLQGGLVSCTSMEEQGDEQPRQQLLRIGAHPDDLVELEWSYTDLHCSDM